MPIKAVRDPISPAHDAGTTTIAATIGTLVGAALVPAIGPGGLAAGVAVTAGLTALGNHARNENAKPGGGGFWRVLAWLG